MFAALGRWQLNKLSIGGLMKDLEGGFKIPLFLLLCCAKGRRAAVLAPREPGALFKTVLGSPNGTKDGLLKEFILRGRRPLTLTTKSTEMSTSRGVASKYYKIKNKNKVKKFLQYPRSTYGGPGVHRRHTPSSCSPCPQGKGNTCTPSVGWSRGECHGLVLLQEGGVCCCCLHCCCSSKTKIN